jgi:tetratricopeptide (TPR) repeat protein
MRYKGKMKALPQIGRELAVDAVVAGSVERRRDRVRVRVQLIQAATDQYLWAQSYDRELCDFVSLENEFARDLAAQVAVQMGPQPAAAPQALQVRPGAFEDYLKGRYCLNRRDLAGLEKAQKYFQRAIGEDANYAPFHAGLSASYLLLGVMGLGKRPAEWLLEARLAANRAVSLDPTLAEAHVALAMIAEFSYEFQESEREYKLAISLNPNSAIAHHWYGSFFLLYCGRFEEANREMEQARALDPMSPIMTAAWGFMLYFERRFTEAYHVLSDIIDMIPAFAEAYLFRALVLLEEGTYQAAIADLRHAQRTDSTLRRIALLGFGLGVVGKRRQARAILSQLTRLSRQSYVSAWLFAMVYLGLGDKDATFAWLDRAYEERCIELIGLHVGPLFAPLRDDPRFGRLLARVGLPSEHRISR